MSLIDNKIIKLSAEIDAIYSAMAERNGLLTDTEFDAIEAKRAEIGRLLHSPITQRKTTNPHPERSERTATSPNNHHQRRHP
jgi:hypothetical protein